MAGLIIVSIVSIGFGVLLWHMADKRGANRRFWAVMGFLLGPFAIPFIYLTKDKSSKDNPSKM